MHLSRVLHFSQRVVGVTLNGQNSKWQTVNQNHIIVGYVSGKSWDMNSKDITAATYYY